MKRAAGNVPALCRDAPAELAADGAIPRCAQSRDPRHQSRSVQPEDLVPASEDAAYRAEEALGGFLGEDGDVGVGR